MTLIMKKICLLLMLLLAVMLSPSCGCSKPDPETPDTPKEDVDPVEPATFVPSRNCMTEPYGWMSHSPSVIQTRFDYYKNIGVNVLRVGFHWDSIENAEGVWKEEHALYSYLQLAKENGFRVKLILGVLMNPPSWYLVKNPDAKMIGQNGMQSSGSVSFWYDGLEEMFTTVSRKMIDTLKEKDLWDIVDYVIPSLGTAGEPLYPPAWTQPTISQEQFWCYADNAKASFRASMQAKYGTVQVANDTWGTDFASWDDVTVLMPGEKTGLYWNDVLTWYRDTKREKVKWIIDFMAEELKGSGKKLLIYAPGVQFTTKEWKAALTSKTGGSGAIMIMEDTDYLLDEAAKTDALIQYTGLTPGSENKAEIARIQEYIRQKGYDVGVYGENVGDEGTASRISDLQKIVVGEALYGFDYTNSAFLFGSDMTTPIESRYKALSSLYKAIDDMYR